MMRTKIFKWIEHNPVAVLLSAAFIAVYIAKELRPEINDMLGTCSLRFINGEYYRWFTCSFLHYGLYHLFGNIITLTGGRFFGEPADRQMENPFLFLRQRRAWRHHLFMDCIQRGTQLRRGASGGIFALIAALVVCWLRFPEQFRCKWYRPDVLITIVYFIVANENWSSVLTHISGFAFGVVLAFLCVVFGLITAPCKQTGNEDSVGQT